VNKVLAREILTPYRPGTADQNDPEFAEALAMVRGDPELARWFDEHCARYEAIRAKFQQIPISEGLKEQIISERKAHQALGSRRKAALFAVAAAFVLALIAVSSFYHRSGEDKTFSGFRNRMAKKVTRVYPAMDLETSDPQQIRRYLAQNQGHADYVLPAPLLEKSASTGCAILRWQNQKVSMICFNSGRSKSSKKADLFLFVIDRSAVPNAPAKPAPEYRHFGDLTTASWSSGDKTYLLGGFGDEEFIRKYL